MLALYLRGAATARLQVRSCDDAACSGEVFVGPSGLATEWFDESDNAEVRPNVWDLTGLVGPSRYFQYRAGLERAPTGESPIVRSVSASAVVP